MAVGAAAADVARGGHDDRVFFGDRIAQRRPKRGLVNGLGRRNALGRRNVDHAGPEVCGVHDGPCQGIDVLGSGVCGRIASRGESWGELGGLLADRDQFGRRRDTGESIGPGLGTDDSGHHGSVPVAVGEPIR
ncbi:Uncharacterised protein [Mycobacteroides abscessus subsp. massiliense]|nr:Uncharacterised protein [Mycobacteroides abscessus subsp. massiliense]